MSRPFKHVRTIIWKFRLPITVAAAVEETLLNQVTGRPKYGSKGELLTELLSRHLAEQEAATVQLQETGGTTSLKGHSS